MGSNRQPPATGPEGRRPPVVEIVTVGDGLARGRRVDRAGPLIARALASLGLEPRRLACVRADAVTLAALLDEARPGCDALVVAGDEAIARRALRALGVEAPFAGVAELGRCRVFVLPAEPPEMEVAIEQSLLPALAALAPRRAPVTIAIRVFPRTAAEVEAALAGLGDREGGLTFEVAQDPDCPEVEVEIHAVAASAREAGRRARRLGVEVCARLGHDVHGPLGQRLEAAVVEALQARGWSLAVVEVGTGGAVCDRLGSVPEGDRVLRLGLQLGDEPAALTRLVGVSPEPLRGGVVSAPAAAALAHAVRRLGDASLGLAVTALPGPAGGTPETPVGLVHFAVAGPRSERLLSRRFRSLARARMRQWSAATALRFVLDRCREKGG
jgi:nicotinamide-nucleotide amidase